jgi:hypothetical protein
MMHIRVQVELILARPCDEASLESLAIDEGRYPRGLMQRALGLSAGAYILEALHELMRSYLLCCNSLRPCSTCSVAVCCSVLIWFSKWILPMWCIMRKQPLSLACALLGQPLICSWQVRDAGRLVAPGRRLRMRLCNRRM